MSLLDDLRNLLSGQKLAWNKPYEQMSTDELIAATSIVHRVPLLTRDRQIRKSRQVPFA